MSDSIRIGDVSVSRTVTSLYSHYLTDLIASMVATDFGQNHAKDSEFESVLPPPYKAVVHNRFVCAMFLDKSGCISDAFFVSHEDFLSAPVVERYVKTLPANHRIRTEVERTGDLSPIRIRFLDSFQFGGLRYDGQEGDLAFEWLAYRTSVKVCFEPHNRVLTVSDLRFNL